MKENYFNEKEYFKQNSYRLFQTHANMCGYVEEDMYIFVDQYASEQLKNY